MTATPFPPLPSAGELAAHAARVPNSFTAYLSRPAGIAALDVPADRVTPDAWNSRYPIGTPVTAYPGSRQGRALVTATRSAAWLLGDKAVVMVDGLAGGIALTHVDVIADLKKLRLGAVPDPHDFDPADTRFARIPCEHPEACSCAADYPDWTPGGAS